MIRKSAVHHMLRRVGLAVTRYNLIGNFDHFRQHLLTKHQIDLVLDIGANTGQFGAELREEGYKNHIVSFEPVKACFAQLQERAQNDSRWDCRNVAVGSEEGSLTINVGNNSQISSLLQLGDKQKKIDPQFAYVSQETVQVVTLDSLLPSLQSKGQRIYLKMDVQGFEMEVLKGAAQSLVAVTAIECELSLVPLYTGGPLIDEMIGFLGRHGFECVNLSTNYWDRQAPRVLQMDGVFLNQRMVS